MKKKLIVIGCIVLALAVLAGGAYGIIVLTNPWHVNDLTGFAEAHPGVVGREIAPMTVTDGAFVILQFTDTHLVNTRRPGSGPDIRTLEMIEYHTARVNPDLVVITGDMLEGRSAQYWPFVDRHAALHGIAGIFERAGQPWTFTPGNNDHEFMGSAEDVAAFLAYHYEYVLLANEPGLPGAVNFTLPLLCEEAGFVHQLIFMDSLGRLDIMQPEQADWLAEQLPFAAALGHQTYFYVPASIFFHYNTPMFHGAGYRFGGREGDTVVDEVILAAGNVGLVSVGHTHPEENWLANVDGMYLKVVRASGYRRGDDFPGAAVITIRPGEDVLYEFEEIVF